MQMSLGEKAMLRITSDYGYGARGAGGVIPPNADLNFEVELLAINGKSELLSCNVVVSIYCCCNEACMIRSSSLLSYSLIYTHNYRCSTICW